MTLLVALLAMVLVAATSTAIAQDAPQAWAKKEGKAEAVVDEDVKAKAEKGKAEAVAGGAKAKAGCPDVPPEAKAGDVVAKADCPAPKKEEAKPAPPPEKKEEKKEEKKKELPKSGGTGSASLLALGAGALLVSGGLLARRFVR